MAQGRGSEAKSNLGGCPLTLVRLGNSECKTNLYPPLAVIARGQVEKGCLDAWGMSGREAVASGQVTADPLGFPLSRPGFPALRD